jgi:hypothetical protein
MDVLKQVVMLINTRSIKGYFFGSKRGINGVYNHVGKQNLLCYRIAV